MSCEIIIDREFDIPSGSFQQRHICRGRVVHTTEYRLAKATWTALLETVKPETPCEEPVTLEVTLRYHGKEDGPKTTPPDGDNLLKVIKDAATAAGWWKDDALVWCESISRITWKGLEGVRIEMKS